MGTFLLRLLGTGTIGVVESSKPVLICRGDSTRGAGWPVSVAATLSSGLEGRGDRCRIVPLFLPIVP